MSKNINRYQRYLIEILILAIIYHLGARLGLQMAYVQANISPVWPPSGIALAALLLLGINHWPGIALGVIVGSLITGAPITIALGLGLANTAEALIGAWILKRLIGFHNTIDRIRDVIGLAVAAAPSTAVSASIGVLAVSWFGSGNQVEFFTLWATWWVGNLLGILVVTPLILVLRHFFPRTRKPGQILEGVVFVCLLILVTGYVFGTSNGSSVFHQALIYVIFPFAIWAALRLEQSGAVTAVFIVSGISIWGTIHGFGPFSKLPINESLLLLQTFTGVVALTSLTLSASASERRYAERALNRRVEDLAALNDAAKEFLSNPDTPALYNSICRLAVDRLGLSTVWIELVSAEKHGEHTLNVAAVADQSQVHLMIEKENIAPTLRKNIIHAQQTGLTTCVEKVERINASGASQGNDENLSFAAVPLNYGGKVIGVLAALRNGSDGFPKEQLLLLESYATLAVLAIQNSWLFDQVRVGNEQLHALSHRLMDIQEQERMHLSRELHDESGQILAALMVRLGLLERDAQSPELMVEHIAELKQIVTEVLNNLHSLAVKLRPASLDHLGLITALQQYIQEFSRQYDLRVQFDAEDIQSIRLRADIETAFYRIVQESLTNVALHAQAKHVDILINRRNGSIVMTIEDDGVGFNPIPLANENRLGLFGMRERVQMLGGKFLIESAPGKGATISIEVPYDC